MEASFGCCCGDGAAVVVCDLPDILPWNKQRAIGRLEIKLVGPAAMQHAPAQAIAVLQLQRIGLGRCGRCCQQCCEEKNDVSHDVHCSKNCGQDQPYKGAGVNAMINKGKICASAG